MRILLLLPLVAAACVRSDASPDQPPVAPPALALSPVTEPERGTCVFAETLDGPPLLAVWSARGRTVGEVRVGEDPVTLAGTAIDQGDRLPAGAQLEGAGLSVAVQPDAVPAIPVGAGGLRRPATLTVAAAGGGEASRVGVWSCGGRPT